MLTLYGVSITTENAQHILASLFVDGARATARRSRGDDRSRPLCEHAFVMSQGSARIRYQRSIQARNVFLAETAAFEMGTLSLEDALQLACCTRKRRTTSSTRPPSDGSAGYCWKGRCRSRWRRIRWSSSASCVGLGLVGLLGRSRRLHFGELQRAAALSQDQSRAESMPVATCAE